MKISSSLLSLTLVTATFALSASPAHAATYHTAAYGDIYLGVYDSIGAVTGQYIVDLGSYTQFISGASQTFTLNIYNDLTTYYGSEWQSSTTLKFALFGAANVASLGSGSTYIAASTSFASRPTGSLGFVTPRNAAATNYGAASGFSDNGSLSAFARAETVEGSQAVFVPASDPAKYFNGGSPGASTWTLTTGTTTNIASVVTSALDLYEILPKGTGLGQAAQNAPSVRLGTVAFNEYGDVVFTSALTAVPEPASYALIAGGAMGALVLGRVRRKRAAHAA